MLLHRRLGEVPPDDVVRGTDNRAWTRDGVDAGLRVGGRCVAGRSRGERKEPSELWFPGDIVTELGY